MTEPLGVVVLKFAGRSEAADLATFLDRAAWLDPATLVRLRSGQGRVTAFVRLPFGVLVSRTARFLAGPEDVTLRADELVAVLTAGDQDAVRMPEARDLEWRGALPPAGGWERVDDVPAEVIHRLVRAGATTLRTASSAVVGDSLLDHQSLTVSGGGHTVALPLRVLSAVWRMGFLGPARADPEAEKVIISVCGGWARIAATFGSAYQGAGGPPAFRLHDLPPGHARGPG